jgi:hypothetical protein
MKLEFTSQIFEKKKSSNIGFHENPSSGSRVLRRGRTEMSKLIVTSRKFANATKNMRLSQSLIYFRLLGQLL